MTTNRYYTCKTCCDICRKQDRINDFWLPLQQDRLAFLPFNYLFKPNNSHVLNFTQTCLKIKIAKSDFLNGKFSLQLQKSQCISKRSSFTPYTTVYGIGKVEKNIEAKSCLFSVFKGAYDSGCYKDQLKCYISSLTHKTKPTK